MEERKERRHKEGFPSLLAHTMFVTKAKSDQLHLYEHVQLLLHHKLHHHASLSHVERGSWMKCNLLTAL